MTAGKMPGHEAVAGLAAGTVSGATKAPGLSLQRCEACSAWQFPPRRRCGQCGGTALGWATAPVEGVVEDTTVLRRGAGLAAGEVRYLGTVRHVSGARLIARLTDALEPGAAVSLELWESGAIWATPREA